MVSGRAERTRNLVFRAGDKTMPIGAIVGAGASLLGGLFGSSEKKKDRAMQKEFAQQGVRWRVEDAKQAGIHPLAALGFNAPSYTPVAVGDMSLGDGIAQAGQGIGRAIEAKATKAERAMQTQSMALDLERKQIENDILKKQAIGSHLALTQQAGQPPAMPTAAGNSIPGQGDSDYLLTKPLEVNAPHPDREQAEGGNLADIGYIRTNTGWMPVQSEDAKERLEEDWIGSGIWQLRNRFAPTFGKNLTPPAHVPLKDGHQWVYDAGAQEYRQVPIDKLIRKKLF